MDQECVAEVINFLKTRGIVFRHSSELTSKVLFNGNSASEVAKIAQDVIGKDIGVYGKYYEDIGETYTCLICREIFEDILISGEEIKIDKDIVISEDILIQVENKNSIDFKYIDKIKDILVQRYIYSVI